METISIRTQEIKQDTKKGGLEHIVFPAPIVIEVKVNTKPNKVGAFRGEIITPTPDPQSGRLRDSKKYPTYFNVGDKYLPTEETAEPTLEEITPKKRGDKSRLIEKYLQENPELSIYKIIKKLTGENPGVKVYFSEVQRVFYQLNPDLEIQ